MRNEAQNEGPETKNKIDIKESWDINYWCDEFNLKADELKEIVKLVGPSAHEVRLYLAKKSLLDWPSHY